MRAPGRPIPLEQSPDGAREQSRNVARVTTEITRDIYPMLVYRLGGGEGGGHFHTLEYWGCAAVQGVFLEPPELGQGVFF